MSFQNILDEKDATDRKFVARNVVNNLLSSSKLNIIVTKSHEMSEFVKFQKNEGIDFESTISGI